MILKRVEMKRITKKSEIVSLTCAWIITSPSNIHESYNIFLIERDQVQNYALPSNSSCVNVFRR